MESYDVPRDGKFHVMWQHGPVTIRGYSGEFSNVSYHLFVGEDSYFCSYNPRDLFPEIERWVGEPVSF